MKNIFLFFWLLSANKFFAQDCNKEVIMNVKGKWTTLANNIVYPEKTFPSNQYSQLYTRLDKIANMFQQAYPQPTGIEAKWYRSIRGAAVVKNGPCLTSSIHYTSAGTATRTCTN